MRTGRSSGRDDESFENRRLDLAGIDHRRAEQPLVAHHHELDRFDRVVLVRGRHARTAMDHLDIFAGRNRPSAHLRPSWISTAASPRVCVSSATSHSSCCRVDGPAFPATATIMRHPGKSISHRSIGCSLTFHSARHHRSGPHQRGDQHDPRLLLHQNLWWPRMSDLPFRTR